MREAVESIVAQAIRAAIDAGQLTPAEKDELPQPCVERPRDLAHGDWASSVALKYARFFGCKPRDAATAIAGHIEQSNMIESVEVAGPGFINMRLSPAALQSTVVDIRSKRDDFGRSDVGGGRKLQVEYVSANPTGPMHVGHGRWAALGDSLSNVLAHAGWDVEREFYINDAGNQMNIFADSVAVRYLQICRLSKERGISPEDAVELLVADTAKPEEEREFAAELGENSYGGAYIVDIAKMILDDEGDVWVSRSSEERDAYFKERAYTQVLAHMKEVLASCGCRFDVWFSERTLHEVDASGQSDITRAIDKLAAGGSIYEDAGATWFRSTDYGDDKNRVLVKADGDYTYFAADIAYHENKFSRGFERVVNIWGADHHGYVPRMQAACTALGHGGHLEIIIGQLVNLLRDGVPVRLSKRAGTMVTFEELLDEVGSDATRYLMISKSTDQQIDFDIDVAKKQDASNPVYYVQYAHARICSILRKATGLETETDANVLIDSVGKLIGETPDLSPLVEESELVLMRKLSEFPETVEGAARDYAPFRLTHYAEELAATFHQFYTRCQVLSDDKDLAHARLALCDASRTVLALTLHLLGVSAPVRM